MKTLIIILLFPILTFSQNNIRAGNWWLNQERNNKLIYITGFFDGMNLGNNFSWWNYSNDSAFVSKVWKSYRRYDRFLNNVTTDKICDGLDTLYSDYRNRNIRIADGFWLVLNSINGISQSDYEKLLESYRRHEND